MVTKISLRATLIELEEGKSVDVPTELRSWSSVRSCASSLAVDFPGRKYKVSLDRQASACKVTRLS